jgi:hypothetical protein
MNLREYLQIKNLTQQEFAERAGLSRKTIGLYLNSPVIPRPRYLMQINKATKGLVSEKDFSADHIYKIKSLIEKYGIPVSKLAQVLGISDVALHHKLAFRSSTTDWELYLMLNYLKTMIKKIKKGNKNAK